MAELIPMEYRIAAAQKGLVRKWGFVLALAAVVAGAGLSYAATWQRRQFVAYDHLNNDFKLKSVIKVEARQLVDRREAMATRMAKFQEVQNDVALLSMLQSISQEFSDNDMLENIALEVHGKAGDERNPAGSFSVRASGVTRSDETLAALLDRLSKMGAKASPAMAVKPGSSNSADMIDGKVVRFQVSFEMPATRVADASMQGAR